MNESSKHSPDGVGILAGFAIVVVAWVGISGILSDSQEKDRAIADLRQQLGQLQRANDICQSEYRGFRDGRR